MPVRLKSTTPILLIIAVLSLSSDLFAQRRGGGSGRSQRIPLYVLIPRISTSGGSHQGHVRVKGYMRRDGIYVEPHHRSRPDGNFGNNWSTVGNINPDTGRLGTEISPPANYRYGSHYRYRQTAPSDNASPRYLSTTAPPSLSSATTSLSYEDLDSEVRLRIAERLQQSGIQVNWRDHSFLEMSDWEIRMNVAERLNNRGIHVDWRQHSFLEMSDWEVRANIAELLNRKGLNVDWQQHPFLEMSDWETRMNVAERLKRQGISVNWREYTFYQLIDIERRAK